MIVEIQRARVWAVRQQPYMATALWALTFIEVKDFNKDQLGPIGCDKWWRVYYDPVECGKLSHEELGSALLHEIGHLIRGHADRCGSRDHNVFNVAGDLAINDDLKHLHLPKWVFTCDKVGLPEGQAEEWYYDKIMSGESKVKVVQGGCGSCAHGHKEAYEGSGVEGEEGVSATRGDLIRHQVAKDMAAQPPGRLSAGWQRWAQQLLKPQVAWTTLLARMVRGVLRPVSGCVDYSYRKPARRGVSGVVMPGMVAYKPTVACVVDTSGSMHESQISLALGEVRGVANAAGAETVVYFVDAQVCSKARAGDNLSSRVKGGGGTNMRVGIEAALKGKPKANVVICLTDLYTPWPEHPTPVPLIVVAVATAATGADVPGWCRVVEVK